MRVGWINPSQLIKIQLSRENANLKIKLRNLCKAHRDKTEVPDPLAVEDLISYKLNNWRKLARLITQLRNIFFFLYCVVSLANFRLWAVVRPFWPVFTGSRAPCKQSLFVQYICFVPKRLCSQGGFGFARWLWSRNKGCMRWELQHNFYRWNLEGQLYF